jgi:beta-glucanase (GH16 family)
MFKKSIFCLIVFIFPFIINSQTLKDDFEGNGNIKTWKGDDCIIKLEIQNPFITPQNNSSKVLEYSDKGGLYANVRFENDRNFDLSKGSVFSFKIYVPSNKISGNQANQVSLKLQDGKINEPWSTQSEIIKPILTDEWQIITFDFAKDAYRNLNAGSLPPIQRKDFNRIVIQVNGENNRDSVLAYIDDFEFIAVPPTKSLYTKLVWSDEFDVNGSVNDNKWFHQTELPSSGSWYNGEIQHYTNRTSNSIVENGLLKVIAKKENFTDQGQTKQYTSARLNSKYAFKYGRVEFSAKLPFGVGTWPAVWMLGKNIDERGAYWHNLGFGNTPWPACGEIDILEHWGQNQNFVQSAIHSPSSFGNTVNLGGRIITNASSSFHLYSMEWTPNKIEFSVDSIVHYTYEPLIKNNSTWPFDLEQYLLINIAILPNISQTFTQSALEIDYIRIYQEETTNLSSIEKNKVSTVYPNPCIDFLNIKTENTDETSSLVNIYSSDGRLLFSNHYKIENNTLLINNLDILKTGIYTLTYTLGNKIVRIKFAKE